MRAYMCALLLCLGQVALAVEGFQIVAPNGGETWYAGATRDIKWEALSVLTNGVGFYRVRAVRD